MDVRTVVQKVEKMALLRVASTVGRRVVVKVEKMAVLMVVPKEDLNN